MILKKYKKKIGEKKKKDGKEEENLKVESANM